MERMERAPRGGASFRASLSLTGQRRIRRDGEIALEYRGDRGDRGDREATRPRSTRSTKDQGSRRPGVANTIEYRVSRGVHLSRSLRSRGGIKRKEGCACSQ